MKRWMLGVAAAAMILPLAVQAMSVDQFLARANALKAKGMMAMLSPDIGVLKGEMNDAIKTWQANRDARKAAHKPPLDCAPDDARLTRDEVLNGLAALPPAQRAGSVKDGFAHVIANRYPCR